MKLRTQLAATLAALAAAATIIGSLASYQATATQLQSETDSFLTDRLESATAANEFFDNARFGPFGGDDESTGPRFGAASFGSRFGLGFEFVQPDADTVYLNADGSPRAVLATTQITPTNEELAIAATGKGQTTRTTTIDGRTYQIITAPLDPNNPTAGAVQIARDITETNTVLAQLRTRLTLTALAITTIAALIGWASATRLARPLEQLRHATNTIADTKQLHTRLVINGTGEVAEVTQSFNTMITELDSSQRQQQQLVLDANHELRTPIAALSANLQLLDRIPADDPERSDILAEAQRELAELTNLTDQLTATAATHFNTNPQTSIDLQHLLETTIADYRTKTSREISLQINHPATITGDFELLSRALLNLLSNADKHSPNNHPIEVAVDTTTITIQDHGTGINPTDLPHIFDPFYRADTSRTQPGSGLGLHLTKQILDNHNATITLTPHPHTGTIATITFNNP